METKFTKGEWKTKANGVFVDNKLLITCWHARDTDEEREPGESWLDMRKRTAPEREINNEIEPKANAKLIAAAPEMFNALIQLRMSIMREINPSNQLLENIEKIDVLIEKATQ